MSKPGLRVYAKSTELPQVLGGLGVAIISTSQDAPAGFAQAAAQDVRGMRVGIVRAFMEASGLTSEVASRTAEERQTSFSEMIEIALEASIA